MNFMFEWQEELIFELTCNVIFYYIDILMTAFLTIFRRFPTTFGSFPKIFEILHKGHTLPNIFRNFPKIPKDAQILPKIVKDFRGRPKDVLITRQ